MLLSTAPMIDNQPSFLSGPEILEIKSHPIEEIPERSGQAVMDRPKSAAKTTSSRKSAWGDENCEFCQETFGNLEDHIRTFHGDNDDMIAPYLCSFENCKAMFMCEQHIRNGFFQFHLKMYLTSNTFAQVLSTFLLMICNYFNLNIIYYF